MKTRTCAAAVLVCMLAACSDDAPFAPTETLAASDAAAPEIAAVPPVVGRILATTVAARKTIMLAFLASPAPAEAQHRQSVHGAGHRRGRTHHRRRSPRPVVHWRTGRDSRHAAPAGEAA